MKNVGTKGHCDHGKKPNWGTIFVYGSSAVFVIWAIWGVSSGR